jgi:hypothetical protein
VKVSFHSINIVIRLVYILCIIVNNAPATLSLSANTSATHHPTWCLAPTFASCAQKEESAEAAQQKEKQDAKHNANNTTNGNC